MLLIGLKSLRFFAPVLSRAFTSDVSPSTHYFAAPTAERQFLLASSRALARGVLLNRRCASIQEPVLKIHQMEQTVLNYSSKAQRNSAAASLWRDLSHFETRRSSKSEGGFRG